MTTGTTISPYYDSLLTKVISHAPTYKDALMKLDRALNEFFVRGVKTNIGFVINVLRNPEFKSGLATTSFIERNADTLFKIHDDGIMPAKLCAPSRLCSLSPDPMTVAIRRCIDQL